MVLYHAARHLNKAFGAPILTQIFQFGHAGVDFFFVISGFIILYVHYDDVGRPARIGHYAARRFTRVMPTYWVALAITLLMDQLGHHSFPSAATLFWSVTLLPSDRDLLLGVAWTLRYELVFYAMFALLIWRRRFGLALGTIWLAAIGLNVLGLIHAEWLPTSLLAACNLEFFMGMAAAYILRKRMLPAPCLILLAGAALFAIAALAEDARMLNGYADAARAAYGIPSMLIVLGATEASRQSLVRVPGLLRILGSASYSIYLFQFVFIGTAWQVLHQTGLDLRLPVVVSFGALAMAAVGGSVLTSRLVEFPLIRLMRRRRPVAVVTA